MKTHRIITSLILTFVALGMESQLSAEEPQPKPLDVKTFRDKADRAYFTANRENKYLLLFFSSGDSRDCMDMREALQRERLAKFSDKWIVTDTDPKLDDRGKSFAEQFGVDAYPTLVLIKTTVNPDTGGVTKLDVVGRLTGGSIDTFFTRAVKVYESKEKELDVVTYHDRVFPAWERTKQEGKYFVVLFNADYAGFADRTMDNLTDPRMAKYSDKVIFVDTDPDYDTDAEFFVERFDVKKYPTILLMRPVIDPETKKVRKVDLIGRMTGEQTAEEMDEYFEKAIGKYERELASQGSRD